MNEASSQKDARCFWLLTNTRSTRRTAEISEMVRCGFTLRSSVLLCLCLTQLTLTQGRCPSGEMATRAGAPIPTKSNQNDVSSTLEVRITATFRRGKFIATALRKGAAVVRSEDALPLSRSSTRDAVNPIVNGAPAPAPTTSRSPDFAQVTKPVPTMTVPSTKAAPAATAPATAPARDNMCIYDEQKKS
ncbi:g9595 [Coccomyxa viridis]|uniref:G9595 protein n=1 Tax=Coccomyxa viridis TaxID=1274662 RepID=A0ABP1G605_9CHLO